MPSLAFTRLRRPGGRPLLALRRPGRQSAIGWIHNQRRALGPCQLVSPVVPKLVVGNHASRRVDRTALPWINQITILASIRLRFKARRFLVRQNVLASQRAGSFQWSNRAVVPDALQIWLTIRRPRRSPRFRGVRLRDRCRGLGGDRDRNQPEDRNENRQGTD